MFESRYQTLVDLCEHSVTSFGPRPLFGVKEGGIWKYMTYQDFGEKVACARVGLKSLGVGPGDRVAIVSNNRPEWAISAFATLGLGASFVPMYESQAPSELNYIVRDSGAKVAIVARAALGEAIHAGKHSLPELKHIVVIDAGGGAHEFEAMPFDALVARGEGKVETAHTPEPGDLAGLIYTSGTTGLPKGVMLTHLNLASNVSAALELHPMSPEDRSLSFLPWAHCFGQTAELYGLMARGASMAIAESTQKIVENLSEVRPTVLVSVPRIFNRIYDGLHKKLGEDGGAKKLLFEQAMRNEAKRSALAKQGRTSLAVEAQHKLFDSLVFKKVRARFGGRLRFAISGGAALSPVVGAFIDALGIRVYEGYGLTETSPVAAVNAPSARKLGSVGKPIPGVCIDIDTSVTGDEREGEIIVHGHCVMKGYYGLEDENKKVFTDKGGFRTGDLGFIDDEGFLFITGRIKERYKLENGKYVAPVPLEEQLKLAPAVQSIMVYGDNRPFNVALVVPDSEVIKGFAQELGIRNSTIGDLCTEPEIIERVLCQMRENATNFKQYEKIRKIALIPEDFSTENGMLTPSLKVKRRNVVKQYGDLLDALYK